MKLTFKNDTFKILQIADTQEGRKVSPDTLALINAALDREEPDLVVYSGDQIWGRGFHGDVNQVRRVLKELTGGATSGLCHLLWQSRSAGGAGQPCPV